MKTITLKDPRMPLDGILRDTLSFLITNAMMSNDKIVVPREVMKRDRDTIVESLQHMARKMSKDGDLYWWNLEVNERGFNFTPVRERD